MATSPGRSIQTGSNLVPSYKGPVTIDLFCLLIFYFIRYGDTTVQSNCIFPGRFVPLTYSDWHRGHKYAITYVSDL